MWSEGVWSEGETECDFGHENRGTVSGLRNTAPPVLYIHTRLQYLIVISSTEWLQVSLRITMETTPLSTPSTTTEFNL